MRQGLTALTAIVCTTGYVLFAPFNTENSDLSQAPSVLKQPEPQPPAQIQEKPQVEPVAPAISAVDLDRFKQVMHYAQDEKLSQRSLGDIMQAIAAQFLGSPYQGGLLDQAQKEHLVVTLRQFDCVTFIETVLALSRSIAIQDYSYPTFVTHLQEQRYRQGRLDGYCSRLHYFSEWIVDNQKRNMVLNLTPGLGGMSERKALNFMSHNRSSYPRLSQDAASYHCIQQVEAALGQFSIAYIPTYQINQLYTRIQPGDIVAIATRVPGLDVTHTGLAYRQPAGGIGLIHASASGMVKVSPDLEAYIARVPDQMGIVVVRPLDPRQGQASREKRTLRS